jgi:ribonuclease P protein component
MEMRFTLKKSERLTFKKSIDKLFSDGRWLKSKYVSLVFMETDEELPSLAQALFTVSKRNFRRAVKRNLFKRRMRESYRLYKPEFYKQLSNVNKKVMLGFVYSSKEESDYSVIEHEIKGLLGRMNSRLTKSEL